MAGRGIVSAVSSICRVQDKQVNNILTITFFAKLLRQFQFLLAVALRNPVSLIHADGE